MNRPRGQSRTSLACILLALGCSPESDEPRGPQGSGRDLPAVRPGGDLAEPGARPPHPGTPWFEDVTEAAGIQFVHTSGMAGRKYGVETIGSGAAFLDCDNDGNFDLYIVNGADLPGYASPSAPRNALYRNLGNAAFEEGAADLGVADERYGMGVTAGDYDNDGDADLFVSNFGPNRLYRNGGRGEGWRFTDVTGRSALADDDSWSTGCAFADYDLDGDLDLYVANYLDYAFEEDSLSADGALVTPRRHLAPTEYPGRRDFLYRNDGGDRFADVTGEAGLLSLQCRELGVLFFDFDEDGDPDLFQGNDATPNFLYRNDGEAGFVEIGLPAGVAYNESGKPEGTMGVDAADVNGDGLFDLVATNFQWESNTLYRNLGEGRFRDATRGAGIGGASLDRLAFGTNFFDADNDGDQDLYVANGHIDENIAAFDAAAAYGQEDQLFLNDGAGGFTDVSDRAGPFFRMRLVGRGSAAADYDNDGDRDLFVVNSAQPAVLLRNDTPAGNRWLALRLKGTVSNRDGYGARVEVRSGGRIQVAEARSAAGYLSRSDPRLFFGLGNRDSVDHVAVRWPSGIRQEMSSLPANRVLEVIEPAGPVTAVSRHSGGDSPPARDYPKSTADLEMGWERAPMVLPASLRRQRAAVAGNIDSLGALVEASPGSAGAHLQLAGALLPGGRQAEAEAHYRQALALDPESAGAWIGLGKISGSRGALGRAVRHFEQALRLDPGNAEPHYLLGNIAVRREQLGRAVEHYEQALARDPGHELAWYNLAGTHASRTDFRPALEALERAARALPGNAELRMRLVHILFIQARYDEALEQLRRVEAVEPYHDELHALRARVLRRTGGADAARAALHKGLEGDSTNAALNAQLGILLLEQGEPAAAVGYLTRAVRENPDDAEAYYTLGQAYMGKGETRRGEIALGFFRRLQESDEELSRYKTAVALNPGDSEALYDLGAVYSRMGRFEAARQAYRACLSVREDHAEALNNLGNIYLRRHQPEKAVEVYGQALDRDTTNARVYHNLGIAFLLSGEAERAADALAQAVRLDSSREASRLILARLSSGKNSAFDLKKETAAYRKLAEAAGGGTEE